MEKYRIAVGIPTLKDCSLEAIACTEHLSRKGISAEWENKGYFFRVNTKKGHSYLPRTFFSVYLALSRKQHSVL